MRRGTFDWRRALLGFGAAWIPALLLVAARTLLGAGRVSWVSWVSAAAACGAIYLAGRVWHVVEAWSSGEHPRLSELNVLRELDVLLMLFFWAVVVWSALGPGEAVLVSGVVAGVKGLFVGFAGDRQSSARAVQGPPTPVTRFAAAVTMGVLSMVRRLKRMVTRSDADRGRAHHA
jgi:hypothetical protein